MSHQTQAPIANSSTLLAWIPLKLPPMGKPVSGPLDGHCSIKRDPTGMGHQVDIPSFQKRTTLGLAHVTLLIKPEAEQCSGPNFLGPTYALSDQTKALTLKVQYYQFYEKCQ